MNFIPVQKPVFFKRIFLGSMDEMQKAAIKSFVKKKKHNIMTPLILNAIDNFSKKEIADQNIKKSLGTGNSEMIIE